MLSCNSKTMEPCDYGIFFSLTLIVRLLACCVLPSNASLVVVAALVRRRGMIEHAYFFVVQAAAVSCTATLPPTCKTTQCTWVLADRIAMESWGLVHWQPLMLFRELWTLLHRARSRPQPIPQSYSAVTVPTPPRCRHALPGHVRHHVLLVQSVDVQLASHGFGIIGLEHCGQLLPCLSNRACTVHLHASTRLLPSMAAQTHHEHTAYKHTYR
jgi:hypothetical protein